MPDVPCASGMAQGVSIAPGLVRRKAYGASCGGASAAGGGKSEEEDELRTADESPLRFTVHGSRFTVSWKLFVRRAMLQSWSRLNDSRNCSRSITRR